MRRGPMIVWAAALALLASAVATPGAQAGTSIITVNTSVDRSLSENVEACSNEGTVASQECPLRAALEVARGIVNAGAAGIEVSLPAGNYKLKSSNEPLSLGNTHASACEGAPCTVALVGAGATSTTIDGGEGTGLVATLPEAGGATIEKLTLTNGRAENGGAVFNEIGVPLTVRDVVITENSALISGGGIASIGPLTVLDSRISKNTAAKSGGGVWQSISGLTLERSSVLENHALKAGGGVDVSRAAGEILDSTVARNESPNASALYASGGGARVHYSTLADNSGVGAAIEAPEGGTVELEGSIVSGNVPSQCASVAKAKAVDTNIVHGEDACGFSGPGPLNVDPKLGGALAAGLGEGLALLAGSPAVNAGGSTCPAAQGDAVGPVDQRGLARPQGPACDLGAIEAGADASVSLVAFPEAVAPAGALALTATTSDAGVEAATGTTVTIPVPAGTTFVAAPPACLLTTGPPASVTCSVGTLMPGQSHQTTITVRPERAGALIETATVAHPDADFDTANDSVLIASSVVAPIPAAPAAAPAGNGGPVGAPGAVGRANSRLIGRTIAVDAHGKATIKLSCAASSTGGCQDTVGLYASAGSLPAAVAARKAALLGRGHVHLAAGKTVSVRIGLSKDAWARLSSAHPSLRGRLLLSAQNAVSPASSQTYAVTLNRVRRHC